MQLSSAIRLSPAARRAFLSPVAQYLSRELSVLMSVIFARSAPLPDAGPVLAPAKRLPCVNGVVRGLLVVV